ncbi:MAG: hypothetical protein HWN68_06530 [Desulfobacterales bacterium]|nr:hypothetical protein [Desulfobacterales bacterium]
MGRENEMPIAIFLKQPPIHVVARKTLDKELIARIGKAIAEGKPSVLHFESMEGKPILIPIENLAMVKEVRPEDVKKVEAKGDRLIHRPVLIPPRDRR